MKISSILDYIPNILYNVVVVLWRIPNKKRGEMFRRKHWEEYVSLRQKDEGVNMKKNHKYWLLMSVLVLLFAVIAVSSFVIFFRENAKNVEQANLNYLVQDSGRLAEYINNKFQDSEDYLRNIAAIFADSSIENLDEMQTLLENMEADAPFDNLFFAYPDGTSYRFTGENSSVYEREYFQKALKGESGITEPFISKEEGREVIACYYPIVKKKEVCAVLIGVYYVQNIEEMLQTTFMNERVYSAIIAESGKILVGSTDELNGKNFAEEMNSWIITGETTIENMVTDMNNGEVGILTYKGLKDTSMLIYRPLDKNSWYIIQNLPSAVLNGMKMPINLAAVHLAIGLAVSFCVLYTAIYMWIRKRHAELYVENQRVHAIISVSYSLIFEYNELEKTYAWYGDAADLFAVNNSRKDFRDMLYPEDRENFDKQIKALREGGEYSSELRVERKEGGYLWCDCRLIAIRSLSGKIIRILGIIRNIDEHRKKMSELKGEQELLTESINLLGDSYYKIIMVNLKTGRCRYVKINSKEAETVYEMKAKEKPSERAYEYWYKQVVEKVVHPDYKELFLERFSLEELNRTLSREHPSQTMIYKRKYGGGDSYMWAQAEYILCGNGEEAMVYIKNVTGERVAEEKHRKELEKALEEVSKANCIKTDFLKYISHDLRTPMNAVTGMNQLAQHAIEEGDMKRAKYYTECVHSSAEYLMSLLTDILDMSNFQRDKLKLESKPFSAEAVTEACQNFYRHIAKSKGVSFTVESGLHGEYIGDFMRIRQLLFNLLENAVKFNKPDGKVLLKITSEPIDKETEQIKIIISDTGIGMDEKQIQKLFEPFSRGKIISSETKSGTGIGLAIVKHIVDALEGEIHIESKLGEGTDAEVQFLLKRKQAADAGIQSSQKEALRVLVVDDNELNLEIAVTLLEDEGYSVMSAASGAEALEIFKQSPEYSIDVLLTDIAMPEMDGYALSAAVRELDRKDATTLCIVALSAYSYRESRERVKESGMNAFINKPFEVSEFNRMMEWLL